MSNDFFTDNQLTEKFGIRDIGKSEGLAIPLFEPIELGWVCFVDEHHKTTWSEYRDHLWCYDCKKDYFTLLCPKIVNSIASEEVVADEMARLKPLIDQWTLEKYKNL